MHSIDYYLKHAQTTCEEIRSQLTFGSNSEVDEGHSDLKRFFTLRIIQILASSFQDLLLNEDIVTAYLQLSPWIIEKYGYGHCGELSRAGFRNLINKGIYPIKLCQTTQSDHTFILLGQGPTTVYCDIWANVVTDFSYAQQTKPCRNVLIHTDQPHHLSGTIKVMNSILTDNSLALFKEKMTFSDVIHPLFTKKIMSDEDLRSELPLMRKYYNLMRAEGSNSYALSQFEIYFNGLASELRQDKQSSIPFQLFLHKPNLRPLRCRGWCEPPQDSVQDEQGRTIVANSINRAGLS